MKVPSDKKPSPKWSSDGITKFLEVFNNFDCLWNKLTWFKHFGS